MRKVLVMLFAVAAFMSVGAATVFADDGGSGGGGCSGPGSCVEQGDGGGNQGGNQGPGGGDNQGGDDHQGGGECPTGQTKSGPGGDCHPAGGGDDGQGDDDNPPPPPMDAACPPATGPISSIVQTLSDAIRAHGGAPLADVLDTINCKIIVGVLNLDGPATGM